MENYDLVVIGGGPGGYPAAIRASQLGLRVALVEQGRLGGECVNFGCIPTKAMIRPVELLSSIAKLRFVKLNYDIDFSEYMGWVEGISSKVSEGVRGLLRMYNVDVYYGQATLKSDTLVELGDGTSLKASNIIIATGTDPSTIPGLEFDGSMVHSNRSILSIRRKPSRILIVGSGYIGVEFAGLLAKLGVEVYMVEVLERVLPAMDEDFSKLLSRRLSRLGVKTYTSTTVKSVDKRESYALVSLSNGLTIEVDYILVAVGRRPNTRNLGLENAKVELDDRGYIRVDDTMRTSNPRIYATGDVAGPPLLAHKAFMQAVTAAESIGGLKSYYNPKAIPSVVFTDPEIVSVGLTESEARREGYSVGVVKLPIGALAKAIIEDSTDGFAKIVYDTNTKTILGIHIAAPHASELAGEASLAIELGATLEDLSLTIHPHPTISEVLQEASELALGRPKHYYIGKK
ncbi:MAG: dihydrolipoyl dehydrogenase [Acidilobaceae archaeon]